MYIQFRISDYHLYRRNLPGTITICNPIVLFVYNSVSDSTRVCCEGNVKKQDYVFFSLEFYFFHLSYVRCYISRNSNKKMFFVKGAPKIICRN